MNNKYTKKEIIEILKSSDKELFCSADETRKKHKGNNVHIRGLIEFTNICKQNCFYCGLRCENKNVKRYRLTESEILKSVEEATKEGIKTIVLQGGEDSFFSTKKICTIIEKIKEYNVAVTLSIGEYSFNDYKSFKEAGADRYLLRIETTDEELYKQLHPKMDFKNRIKCLHNLKELGYETGTGCLVGLPKQTIESLANDILFFKEINADMIGIGPFIPHPQTPLAFSNTNNFDLALRVMATTRLILPDINIPATTAMETLKKDGRIIALKSGANVVMPNFTSHNEKQNYEIYPNKYGINKESKNAMKELREILTSIGRSISTTKGYRRD